MEYRTKAEMLWYKSSANRPRFFASFASICALGYVRAWFISV